MKWLKHLKESPKLQHRDEVEAIKPQHDLDNICARFVGNRTLSRLICGSICVSIKE